MQLLRPSLKFVFLIFVFVPVAGPIFASNHETNTAKYVTKAITISGSVRQKLTLNIDDLKKFPAEQVGEVKLMCQTGVNKGKLENIKGVRLSAIMDKAGILAPGHNDVKKMAIIATASDGYKVIFSWNEIFNTPIGEGIMVYYEKDGQPLADSEGRIALISTKDILTSKRHVKWLQDIEVKKVVE